MRETILQCLKFGKENAISSRELSSLLHCNGRTLRGAIKNMRLDGELICSSESGYYLAATPDEMKEFVRHEELQALSRLTITKPFRKKLREFGATDQMSIYDLETD